MIPVMIGLFVLKQDLVCRSEWPQTGDCLTFISWILELQTYVSIDFHYMQPYAKLFFIVPILFFKNCVFPPYFILIRNFPWDIVWTYYPPNSLTFPFPSWIKVSLNKGWRTNQLFISIEVFHFSHLVNNIMLFLIPSKSSAIYFLISIQVLCMLILCCNSRNFADFR